MAAFTLFSRKAATAAPGQKKIRFPAAVFQATGSPPSAEDAARLKAAGKLPGFKPARKLVGDALGLQATGLLVEHAGESMGVKHRLDGVWQVVSEPLPRETGAAILSAVKAMTAPRASTSKDVLEGECVARVGATRIPCRATLRVTPKGEQMLMVFGGELADSTPAASTGILGGLLGRFLRRGTGAATSGKRTGPVVTFDVIRVGDPDQAQARLDQAAAAPGYPPACGLIAAAIAVRASDVMIDCSQKEVATHGDVDGVWRPLQTFDRATGDGIVAVLKVVAGLDPRERRKPQAGQCQTVIGGKPWPCRVVSQGVPTGERVQLGLDFGRPKFKTLADIGMSAEQAARVTELMSLESGLIILATPKRNGLSTLFDGVVNAADRMLREFVVVEDARSPRPEIQNVKPARWDVAKQITPVAAVDLALREYPSGLVTCDLKDPDLAKKLVEQAEQGKLVVVGVRGNDAADGIAAVKALGVDAAVLGRVLLAAIGSRLVRRLCPKCHEEYLPSLDLLAKLKLDPATAPTLRRARQGGCAVCTETGYLGRTGIFEIASGRTLNAYVAKGADAKVLRQAAVKDGMKSLQHDGLAKVAAGVTGIDEIQRVFAKG